MVIRNIKIIIMKQTLTTLAILFALSTQAQKNTVLIKPVLQNWINKDTAYQVAWQFFQVSRDTSIGCNSYVEILDRNGKKLYDKNVPIDKVTLHHYPNLSPIDKYIAFALGLELK